MIAEEWPLCKWRVTWPKIGKCDGLVLKIYLVASEINKKEEAIQCAQVLHFIGEEGFKIYTTFQIADNEKNKLKILLDKFEAHFLPKENLTYECYKFFSFKQVQGQTLDQFVTEAKKMAMKCKLGDLQEDLTKTVIICGVANSSIREKLLQEDDSTSLEKIIEKCAIIEMSKERSEAMNGIQHGVAVDYVRKDKFAKGFNKKKKNEQHEKKKIINNCTRCGLNHAVNKCPAFGKECNFCKMKNHFESKCIKKKNHKKVSEVVEEINIDSSNSNDYLFIGSIENVNSLSINNQANEWVTTLQINNKMVKLKIDTGAMANILPFNLFKNIGLSPKMIKNSDCKLKSYTGDKLNVCGICNLKCFKNDNLYELEFFIVKSNTSAILGLTACKQLNLITRIDSINVQNNEYSKVINKYGDIFTGIGCIETKCSINLVPNAIPVINPIRRVAFPLMEPLKQCLEELTRDKIIEKVEGPSDWVNALVLVRKPNGKLRICLDPKDLNNVIKREYCKIPTFEEISSNLAGATIFSTLDATNGFYQIPLDEESSKLCTFGTPYGRFRFLRLPYGVKCAPEIFQDRFKNIFSNIEGTDIYIDNIIIWGRNKIEHDIRLNKVLDRARENNVKFNLNKCKFGQTEIKYMGHRINENGISPDESKIKAISEMPSPKNKQDVQRLLGMLTYVSRFIKNFTNKTEPLRSLLKNEVEFIWDDEKEKAFKNLKEILTTNPVLQFF